MKKSEIIDQLSKSTDCPNARLRVGDIVTHSGADHLVWLVNESRAALLPLAKLTADPENVSPESELPLVKRLGIKGAIALLTSKTATPPRAKAAKSDTEPKLGKLGGYLGFSVVSIIRTLGKAGWDFKTTRSAFDRESVACADQTIRIQLKSGKDGIGTRAELTAKQIAQLKGKAPKAVSKKTKVSKVVELPTSPVEIAA